MAPRGPAGPRSQNGKSPDRHYWASLMHITPHLTDLTPGEYTNIYTSTMAERPQYFENTLTPLSINATTLSESLQELRIAVRNGAKLIQANTPLLETWGPNGIFRDFPGISSSSSTFQTHNHLITS